MITQAFNDFLDQHQSQMEQTLLELLAVNSVDGTPQANAPFGEAVAAAFEKAAAAAQRLEFHVENKNYYLTIDAGQVRQPNQALGILAHLDVVPPGEGWNYSPQGQVVENRIYGRGSLDDKGPAVAALFAMAAVKNSGLPLARPIRLVLGGNEEKDSRCLEQYVKQDIPLWGGFSPDAQFPIIFAEKGIAQFENTTDFQPAEQPAKEIEVLAFQAGTAVNAVAGKAQATLRLNGHQQTLRQALAQHPKAKQLGLQLLENGEAVLTAIGKSAHGSTPERGESAIKLLLGVLLALPLQAGAKTTWLHQAYHLLAVDYYGAASGVACEDEVSGKLTLNLSILRLNGRQGHLALDMRYPVTKGFGELQTKLEQISAAQGVPLTCTGHKKPLHVPQDAALVQKLLALYRQEADPAAQPLAIGGGTYCRAMPNFVAFGPLRPQDEDTMHQADESITCEHLLFLSKLYAEAIYQLARE